MTMRSFALVIAIVLAAPATAAIIRAAWSNREREAAPGRRALEAVWAVLPIGVLALLVALAAVA